MPFLSPLFTLRDMLNRLFTRILAKTCMLMYFLFIYSSMHKKAEESSIQYSHRVDVAVCVRALQMCVCVCVCASDVCVCVCFRCVCVCASDVCVCVRFRCVCVCVRALQMCVCVRFRCVCVRALQMCVCVRALQCAGNFSHSARLLLQQSRASFMLALYLRAVLISSWTVPK